jgi:hypothetical protein
MSQITKVIMMSFVGFLAFGLVVGVGSASQTADHAVQDEGDSSVLTVQDQDDDGGSDGDSDGEGSSGESDEEGTSGEEDGEGDSDNMSGDTSDNLIIFEVFENLLTVIVSAMKWIGLIAFFLGVTLWGLGVGGGRYAKQGRALTGGGAAIFILAVSKGAVIQFFDFVSPGLIAASSLITDVLPVVL